MALLFRASMRERRPRVAPQSPGERRSAVDARRVRATEEPLDVQLWQRDTYPILEVRNPIHGTAYRVLLPEFPTVTSALCTCTDFARRDLGTCKHIEAGHRWLTDHPDAVPLLARMLPPVRASSIWKEIDRRQAAELGRAAEDRKALRRIGAALFERAPGHT